MNSPRQGPVRALIVMDSERIGGPGKGLFQFLREVRELQSGDRYNFVLSNFVYPWTGETEFSQEAKRQRVRLHPLRQRFTWDPAPFWQAWRLVRREQCTVIQSHGYKSHLVAAVVSRATGIPWIAMCHGWTAENRRVRLFHQLDRLLLPWARIAVAVSPTLRQTVAGIRGASRRTELLLNAVDPEELQQATGSAAVRARCGLTPGDQLIGCFGRLSPEKGHRTLLSAFALVVAARPRTHLVITGDGPERNHLIELCDELAITSHVHFHGHQGAMRDYYEAIDLLVLPSLSEGLPNVILEAMSCGKGVVATEVGGVGEVITSGENGWLVPPAEPEPLAEAVREALSDPDRLAALGAHARESLYPRFSAARRASTLTSLYDELHGEVEQERGS